MTVLLEALLEVLELWGTDLEVKEWLERSGLVPRELVERRQELWQLQARVEETGGAERAVLEARTRRVMQELEAAWPRVWTSSAWFLPVEAVGCA